MRHRQSSPSNARFAEPANAGVRSWAGFGRSTWLSVDGLLGVLASSNESHRLACRAHAGCSLHARDESSENPITDLRKASAADETTTPITIDAQGAACNATECVALEAVPHPVSFLVIVIGPYLQYSVLYIPLV